MKLLSNLLLLLFISFSLSAQSLKPIDLVKAQNGVFEQHTVFSADDTRSAKIDASRLSEYTLLELDANSLITLRQSNPKALSLEIPMNSKSSIELHLVQVNIFSDDYTMIEEPSGKIIEMDRGTHYRGIIAGKENSLVAISIFDNEITGFISDHKLEGNYVLGRLQDHSARVQPHVIYLDTDMRFDAGRSCDTQDVGEEYKPEQLEEVNGGRALTDCVKLLLEVDYNMYQTLGSSTANANNYINALFNGQATLYAGENINTVLSQSFVWSSSSPYTGSSTGAKLNSFQANRNNFNADFANLLTNINFGGLAATINGVCATENNRMCVSGVLNQIANVPTYSFDMEITAHEYGHLFGSFHTHGCYWNGNNTQIDDCASVLGNTEGSACYNASNPILPGNGGTIMSYCYAVNGVGVNFSNGFGPQPGNAIRNAVSNGSCLDPCGGTTCNDNELTLTITTDNYPGETTWTVTNGSGTVASGGPYGSANTTYTESICLVDGCYDFTISDSYGDGICCSYGNGSYTLLASDGSTIVTGGAFGSSETTAFCEPNSSSNCTEIDFNNYTVNSYGGSQDNGTSQDVGNGDGVAIFNNAWKSISLNYTVTANTVLEFQFGSTAQAEIHGIGFDNNNSISSGFTFQLYGTQNWGNSDFDYTSFGNWQSFTIPVGQYYTGSFDRLFFVDDNDANPTTGNSYFRFIKIYEGASCNNLHGDTEEVEIGVRSGNTAMIDGLPDEEGASILNVYPNPANDFITMDIESTIEIQSQVSILNLVGQVVKQQSITLQKGLNSVILSTDQMPTGTYLVKVNIGGRDLIQKISVIQ
ncbi:MAG: zinc-dependent metalloprotease [Saprospiraceae bacterium]|nr:zinc-dependent metalloprotease [Saprospiraceae bacterium]